MDLASETYADLAQVILKGYLRSAVIIDDQWLDSSALDPPVDTTDESDLVDDNASADWDEEDSADAMSSALVTALPQESKTDARLLAELQKALVQEGLLSCGFRYTHQEKGLAVSLAQRADIVVLDWHLVSDDGAEALAILEQLRGNELRFVCIFSGHGRIQEIRDALIECLGDPKPASIESEADLRIGNLIFAIRNKDGLPEQAPGFTAKPEDLLDAALQGLVRNYDGLVQLAMLELTQQHRKHLPKILDRLDGSIDSAVLLEAGDPGGPEDQGRAFLDVLLDEWRAHLEQEALNLQALDKRGLSLRGNQLKEKLSACSAEELSDVLEKTGISSKAIKAIQKDRSNLESWLSEGCIGPVPQRRGAKETELPLLGWAALRAATQLADEESMAPLLKLDALFHQQFELPRSLTQGTLVRHDAEEGHREFLLCISPACDAARPVEKISSLFTFLRTRIFDPSSLFDSDRKRKASYCLVETEGQSICLEILLKQRVVLKILGHHFHDKSSVTGYPTVPMYVRH